MPRKVTGPSSKPEKPIITMGSVSAPVTRTGAQGGAAWMVMEIIEAYSLYDFSDRQWSITLLAGTTLASFAWNLIESRLGRRLIGAEV